MQNLCDYLEGHVLNKTLIITADDFSTLDVVTYLQNNDYDATYVLYEHVSDERPLYLTLLRCASRIVCMSHDVFCSILVDVEKHAIDTSTIYFFGMDAYTMDVCRMQLNDAYSRGFKWKDIITS